uniref:Centrosomal protein 192 n=1 Tax=Salarias fasciatus TaxID=181472 RepID=A0A672H552_SALFA
RRCAGLVFQTVDSFLVWVHFKAPQKYAAPSEELGPAEEFSARVDVEVDGPGPSHVIRSVPLRARSGTARVHAPKDLQVTNTPPASQTLNPLVWSKRKTVPVYEWRTLRLFSVSPQELSLRVGEERGILFLTTPSSSSLLTILVSPCGPQYEVTLRGEVTPEAPPAAVPPSVPPILSNKQFVAWGGVTLGRKQLASVTQQLRLLIRGQDQELFSMFSPEERLTRHGELSIRPREDVTVHLLFAPTRVACMLAKLEIKQAGVRPSQPGVKFTIPLSGYGGTSNIILEDQRKQADGYVATLPGVAVGHVSKVCLCVRNTGSRAAFVKPWPSPTLPSRTVMEAPPTLCWPRSCLFCGDEVSRQQYRRSGMI